MSKCEQDKPLCVTVTWRPLREGERQVSELDHVKAISECIDKYLGWQTGSIHLGPVSFAPRYDGLDDDMLKLLVPPPFPFDDTPLIPMKKPSMVEKMRVYFKGKKQAQQINCANDDEHATKPLFVKDLRRPKQIQPGVRCFPCQRVNKLVDVDLLAELRTEVAFMPRTPLLLIQLKMKAKKFLDRFDMSLFTSQEKYEMIMRAVGAAMLISKEEDDVRLMLDSYAEREWTRPINNSFLVQGQTHPGSVSLMHQRSQACAVRTYLQPRLMSAIVY